MLTTYDTSFDYTFTRATVDITPTLPDVGGDGGGGIPGAVLPFSTNSNLLASCLRPAGQAWDRWAGVPLSRPDYLMPFIVAVPKPDDVAGSAFCTEGVTIVDAYSGEEIRVLTPALKYFVQNDTLYILHRGTELDTALPYGVYRLMVGAMSDAAESTAAISEPFEVKCFNCATTYLIRLKNDTRLGDLLYDQNWEQSFYVEGELTGPTYENSETTSGSEKTGATAKKVWTLTLDEQSEPVADALALASLHRLVEVSTIRQDGSVKRSMQAMAYEAKSKNTVTSMGLSDIELTLPVSLTEWKSVSAADAGCLVETGSGALTEVFCAP